MIGWQAFLRSRDCGGCCEWAEEAQIIRPQLDKTLVTESRGLSILIFTDASQDRT